MNLAVLDVMLPDMDGFTLCQRIREDHLFPIIMLTAKVEDMDKIMGLTLGADDYITKPFNPLELVARVKTQLRRYTRYNPREGTVQEVTEYDFRGLQISKATHKCVLFGEELALTPLEFSILWYLCEHRGNVVSSEELFEHVWGEAFMDSNNTVMAHIARLREKMREHGFGDETVLWCYSPSSCDIVEHLPHAKLVYDCVDRHSAYKGHINPKVVDKMEHDLAKPADQVFATAVGLAETLEKVNPTTQMIPNGAAYEIFSRVQTEKDTLPCPEDMKDLPHPIYGFVGMLQECIDYALIEKLAKSRPNATIFLIGRTLPGVDLTNLKQYPNIVFHGLVPQPELPAYLAQMDVCLNVFRAGALSKDVSPLKFYEYLATGKPIVSTREPLQVEDFKDVVYIARNPRDVPAAVRCRCQGKPSGMDGKTPCLRRAVLVDRARAPDGRGAL